MADANICESPHATGSHVICNLVAKESKTSASAQFRHEALGNNGYAQFVKKGFYIDGSVG